MGLFFSCETSDLHPEADAPDLKSPSDIEAIDGTLHFKDYDVLSDFHEQFSITSEDEIDKWEKFIGFESFRSIFNQSAEEFDDVITREEFEKWKDRYNDILYMDGDEVTPRIPIYYYQIMINRFGEFYVGKEYNKVMEDKIIRILDGDKSKLSRALTMKNSSKEQKILIINFPNNNSIITTRNLGDCYNEPKRIEMEDPNHRKVYLDVYCALEPISVNTPFACQTIVAIQVHGRKRRLWGWHKYKTELAYDQLSFEVKDHDGTIHSRTNMSRTEHDDNYTIETTVKYGPIVDPYEDPYDYPYLQKVKGRGISRGVLGLNRWAVLCCSYSSCPSPTAAPLNPF